MPRDLRRSAFWAVGFCVLLLGGCATQQTQVNQAHLDKAGRINAQLGIDYMQSGNLKRANEKLTLALSQNPNSSTIRYAYALLMQRLGENAKAAKNFRKAIELDPKDADAHNNFGAFLCGQKHYRKAQKQFRDALSNPLYSTPQAAYANSGLCYLQQGDRKRAMVQFKKALKVAPQFVPVLYLLSKQAADRKDWKGADKYLKRIQGRAHYSPRVLALCLKVRQHLGDLNGAAQCARDLYRMFPNSPQAKALLGGGS